MARCIGKGVEHDEAVFCAVDDQRLLIVFGLLKGAKQAVARSICAGNVGVSPGRKQEVHGPSKDTRGTRVLSNFPAWERLTAYGAVVIVEGVLWPFQDCRKIRPLVSEPSEVPEANHASG